MQNVKTNEYELFCYDTKKGMWTKETEEKISRFINDGNTLYYVTDKQVKIVDADNDYMCLKIKSIGVLKQAFTDIHIQIKNMFHAFN